MLIYAGYFQSSVVSIYLLNWENLKSGLEGLFYVTRLLYKHGCFLFFSFYLNYNVQIIMCLFPHEILFDKFYPSIKKLKEKFQKLI